jgi:uncharacterized protein YggE
MRNKLIFTFLLFSTFAGAQDKGNSNYGHVMIDSDVADVTGDLTSSSLFVSGLLNVEADYYVAIFNVIQIAESVDKTVQLMNERIGKFKTGLQRSGIDTLNVRTDMVSFVPKFDIKISSRVFSRTYNEVPEGYELQKNIIIRYSKPDQLDAIVSSASKAEIYDLAKVDYFVNDIKKHYAELRSKCFDILRERMKEYQESGMRLDTMQRAFSEDFGTILPSNRYDQYHAASRPSYSSVKAEVTSFPLKVSLSEISPSRYYSAVSFDKYDVVINPVVDKPMVQLTFQMMVHFYSKSNVGKMVVVTPSAAVTALE